jgi:hypothetical protein
MNLRAWAAQAKRGEQKALAERFGVRPQRLTPWLTGRNAPNLRDGLKLQTFDSDSNGGESPQDPKDHHKIDSRYAQARQTAQNRL